MKNKEETVSDVWDVYPNRAHPCGCVGDAQANVLDVEFDEIIECLTCDATYSGIDDYDWRFED